MKYREIKCFLISSVILSFSSFTIAQVKKVETYWDYDKTKLKEIYTVSTTPPYLKNGNYKMYNENTKLIKDHNYLNGEQNGVCTNYYPNGQIEYQYTYAKGIKNGSFINNSDKQVNVNGTYYNNQYNGVITVTNKKTGKTISIQNYLNGKSSGVDKSFFSNGNLSDVTTYKDGLKNGAYIEYYENGQIKLQATYNNDNLNGLYKSYYENGRPEIEVNLINNKKNGICKIYYSNGQLKQSTTYISDIKQGKEVFYSANGFWELNSTYSRGELSDSVDRQPIKINMPNMSEDEAELKMYLEKNYYSFGNSIATDFLLLGENDQMKIEYRIARNLEKDVILVLLNIIPQDTQFKPMIACSSFNLLDKNGNRILKFESNGEFLKGQTEKLLTIELKLSDCKNFNYNISTVLLKQIEIGNCGNEEGIANAFGYSQTFKRKPILINTDTSDFFNQLTRQITN